MGKEAINNSIGVPWRLVDGTWPVDGPEPEFGVDPLPPPPIPLEGAQVQRELPIKTLMPSVLQWDVQVAMQPGLENEHKRIQIGTVPALRGA